MVVLVGVGQLFGKEDEGVSNFHVFKSCNLPVLHGSSVILRLRIFHVTMENRGFHVFITLLK